ncbi:TolC family protein [Chitinophaga barathri]|uniref:TolC family protein n=1 Tax=Chitinophaga barathri TaxID=1647451 RepID=A0A3N4MH22_9BACT|nr:TolC family protein [Chitinophaga barathri]RPD39400.1 TolC family protein [Chitinophaga barathri]
MKPFLSLLMLMACLEASAQQPFTLDSAWASARRNYPLLKQQEVTDQVTALQLRNIRTNYLPQVELNGKATYQSEVVSIPIKLPNVNIPTLPKDQYNATLDVKQVIYDGGTTAGQRELQLVQQQAEKQKVEVEMYKLRQQVMQVFFNALLWDEHITARKQMIQEISQRRERLQAGVDNGTVLASQVDILKAELLKAEQQLEEATTGKTTALNILGLLTGKDVRDMQNLQMPAAAGALDQNISRPELDLYRMQTDVLRQQSKLTGTKSLPKVSAFAQGGYGRPGLNVLDNRFDFYYIGGLRLQWTLWNWRYNRTERDILRVQEQSVQSQSETFTLQTKSQLLQQSGEISTLASAMVKDKEIVSLRTKVKDVSAAQLDNGVLTVHDYLSDLFAETQAVITQKTHEIQWVYATIHYQVIKGY